MYLFTTQRNHHASQEFFLNFMESLGITHAAAYRRAPVMCELTGTGEARAPKYSGMPNGRGPAAGEYGTISREQYRSHSIGLTGIDNSAV
jgi:hypothetical protein